MLRRVKEKRALLGIIKQMRFRMIGHILRHEGFMQSIIEGVSEGKIGRGRPRLSFVKQLVRDAGVANYRELKLLAEDRIRWRAVSNHLKD